MQLKLMIICSFSLLFQSCTSHEQKITLSGSNVPLEQVFIEIKKQTGYRFLYSNNVVTPTIRITVDVENATLKETMKVILKDQPLVYENADSVVVIGSTINNVGKPTDTPGHQGLSNNLLIAVIMILLFARVYNKLNKKKTTPVEKKKGDLDAFDELISLAQSGNISRETKRKIIQLWLSDQGEMSRQKENSPNKSDAMLSEAENLLKTAVLGYHCWELWEAIDHNESD